MIGRLIQKNIKRISPNMFKRIMNFYPPFLGSGISISSINSDYTEIAVQMKLTWYNRNYVGTQFGGSLYAMTDPFYMLMLMNNLGLDYIVWDKAAQIDFKKPGKGKVWAHFSISHDLLNTVKEKTATGEKYVFDLPVDIKNSDGEVIAAVIKTMYVRKKSTLSKN